MSKPRSRTLRRASTPKPRKLAKTLRQIAQIALGSSLGIAAGCASEHSGRLSRDVPNPQDDAGLALPRGGDPGWTSISCGDEGPELLVSELALRGVDYMALFQEFERGMFQDMPGYLASAQPVTQSGDACATSEDAGACDPASNAIAQPSAACTSDGKCGPFVLIARDHQLQRIDTRAGLLSWLGGKIRTGEGAVLLGAFDGHGLACPFSGSGPGTETRAAGDGFDIQTITKGCRASVPQLVEGYHVSEDATLTQTEGDAWPLGPRLDCTGRRPAGLRVVECGSRSALGAFFARAAQLEAASIFAFARLARELDALHAPAPLASAALSALFEEVRHTRLMGALAQRFGARVHAPEIAPMPMRRAFAIALENAVEGCVRETYGALLAHHQAAAARDPQIRLAMSSLAQDEARHAMLAWQVAAWLEPRLSHTEQRELACARHAALAELSRELDSGLLYADEQLIGWPSSAHAAQLLLQLTAALA